MTEPADHQPTTTGSSQTGGAARHTPVHTVVIPPEIAMVTLLGPRDELLRTMERQFPETTIHVRGNEFHISGPSGDVALVERTIDELLAVLDGGQALNRDAVERSIQMLQAQTVERPADVLTMNIVSNRGRTIRPKTLGQKHYVDAIDEHTIVFGIGPAGTGKTYLAMAKAVAALQAKKVNRIILTRPAVEAGERLGFLPGTLNDKIDPYLRPLYDALHDMVDPESIPKLMAAGTIEVAPLAYMRGRAQPLDAMVLTPEGFRAIGDLMVGDLVTGSDGRPTPVIGVYPQGRRRIYRVTTEDGASTRACGEHLWTVRTPSDTRRGTHRVLRTHEMIGSLRRHRHHQYELPVMGPAEMIPLDVPMDPYALGRLLGDRVGSTARARRAGVVDDGALGRRTAVQERVPDTIPGEYLVNSLAVRVAVLQGLCDGRAEPMLGAAGSGVVRFDAAGMPDGRDDVVHLAGSLGGTADRADADILDIRLPEGIAPFRLARKAAAYERTGGGRPRRFVESIEPLGEAETVCIQVLAEDSLYVTDDFIVTHNTLNDAFIILDEAQNTSPEQMKMFLTRLGFGSKMVVTGDVTQVDLPGGVQSGLRIVQDILDGIEDVHFSMLTAQDVVRHRLVGDIVDAYGRWDAAQQGGRIAREHRRAQRD
ncbi:PhoH family protein [Nostocoides japonicum T1-X7]|uniref:PhoH-like protein n=1 Tax=Nostocoides japonicum T1-X7 TaxID=1194083 RepID=A0A077LYQ2_9MICO|nr:PhoH family protein [Tetrasphaera japonica T1-X7]